MAGSRQNGASSLQRRCPHCHSVFVKSFLRYREQESLRCRDCGGLFNRPGRDTKPLYDQRYYETVYVPRMEEQLSRSRRVLDVICQFTQGDSILDYGCGAGVFLMAARESGFSNNVGADTSSDGLRLARKNLGEGVALIHLPSERLPERKFQVIALMDTISAVPDARTTLANLVERYLDDAGVVAIRTPEVRPSYFRVVKLLSFLLGKKQASRLMFAESRYALFDVASLRRLLISLGLTVVFLEIGSDYAVTRKAKGIAGPFWAILWRSLHRPSVLVIARAKPSA